MTRRSRGKKRPGRPNLPPQNATPQETRPTNFAEQEHQDLAQVESSFSGPLPPPTLFEHYDKVLPGTAERIVKMAESEQEHRHFLDSTILKGDQHYRFLGMICAFLVWMAAIVGAMYLTSIGKDWMGGLIFLVAVAGVVRQFIQGKNQSQ